jgi:hypothetical protein
LAFVAGVGWRHQAGEVLLKFSAEYGAGHE